MGGRRYAHVDDPEDGLQRQGARIGCICQLTVMVQYAVKDAIPLYHGARTPGLPWHCKSSRLREGGGLLFYFWTVEDIAMEHPVRDGLRGR